MPRVETGFDYNWDNEMSGQSPQVFISYQRTDEPLARQVREHLVANGVKTWMDQYDIPVGAYWPDEIDKGLAESDIVVGVLSPDSVESRNVTAADVCDPVPAVLVNPTSVHRLPFSTWSWFSASASTSAS